MKILKKRILATSIDYFVYGFCFALVLESFGVIISSEAMYAVCVIPLIFFKDCVFRNASLGKRMLGVSIYTIDWQMPTMVDLIKRLFYQYIVGSFVYLRVRFGGNWMDYFEWEIDTTKMIVIDNKVFERLKKEIEEDGANFQTEMSKRYKAYLASIYMK